jgi:hypothetical protein
MIDKECLELMNSRCTKKPNQHNWIRLGVVYDMAFGLNFATLWQCTYCDYIVIENLEELLYKKGDNI